MPGTERIKFIKERYKDKVGKSFASNLGDIEKVFGEADGFTNSVYELLADTRFA